MEEQGSPEHVLGLFGFFLEEAEREETLRSKFRELGKEQNQEEM